ncbi:MAG: type III polyketide synthase [Deltaproteobacteria bacterium]|nr:MAG: type III polyketide synthase [Deltaproteobacteria bacterium]
MPYIAATETAFPPHYHSQEALIAAFRELWAKRYHNPGRIEQFHRNVLVGGRHLAYPIERYAEFTSFGASNDAWIEAALGLGEETLRGLLGKADLPPSEVSLLAFTTVTGIAVPSIDARLMNRIPFSPRLKRLPIFGLGCLAGAAGVARVADYLAGHPREAAILLSVELCSLTLQREDLSIANIVSSGLFGDGAAAVLLVGDEHPLARGPAVVASRSAFFPDSEGVMGWKVVDTGFQIVLTNEVPEFARHRIRPAVSELLSEHGLEIGDITHWIAHPGGPKVIDALEEGLSLERGALDLSRESLARVGNLSSASVLFVLQETLQQHDPAPGTYGMMLAMGPAFCAEVVLLRW